MRKSFYEASVFSNRFAKTLMATDAFFQLHQFQKMTNEEKERYMRRQTQTTYGCATSEWGWAHYRELWCKAYRRPMAMSARSQRISLCESITANTGARSMPAPANVSLRIRAAGCRCSWAPCSSWREALVRDSSHTEVGDGFGLALIRPPARIWQNQRNP